MEINYADKRKIAKKTVSETNTTKLYQTGIGVLMSKCGCQKGNGGRGSGIRFYHENTGRILAFDEPHPESTLYLYQVKLTKKFLVEIGEYKED